MNTIRVLLRNAAVAICMDALLSGGAIAEFPERSIRIIVPFPAGGSADVRTRQLADILSKQIKQQVIIDNRPGAAGNIGSSLGAKAQPDGYTVLYTFTTSMAVNPHLYKDSGFDPLRDLAPIIVTLSVARGRVFTYQFEWLREVSECSKVWHHIGAHRHANDVVAPASSWLRKHDPSPQQASRVFSAKRFNAPARGGALGVAVQNALKQQDSVVGRCAFLVVPVACRAAKTQ